MTIMLTAVLFTIFGAVYCAPSEAPCPAPIVLEHGKTFLYEEGRLLKYVCEPGYVLFGKEINRCIEGKWEELHPTCLDIGYEDNEDPIEMSFDDINDELLEESEQEINATAEELPLGDEASVHMLKPLPKVITKARNPKTTDLKEDKKRSHKNKNKSDSKSSLINLEDENAKLPSLPKDATPMDEEGYQSDEEALRQYYWYAHYYPYLYQYGAPGVMTLTDSQMAWINSLHPELRDQYLKGMHVVRVADSDTPKRMESLTAREAYNYVYSYPYVRRPVSVVVNNVPATYDYSCNRAGYPVISAPRLPNMRVARYDSRKNVYEPHNYYLSAVYQCDAGYYMLDSRFSELYCSRGQWVGQSPVCVPNP